ncbi:Rhs element Vgr protein [Pseudomonas syringae pv. delphinii]|uniref:Rhs element Vgr protein n=1 Tax=Pseudomonas syringae pv. delphinii TaxID=192088 RepID=A0A3M4JHV1_9PSED|nr:Rhs element Vgr protein [Pseudomonas syringae pv. delphinii]
MAVTSASPQPEPSTSIAPASSTSRAYTSGKPRPARVFRCLSCRSRRVKGA